MDLYKPHAIVFPSGAALTQLEQLDPQFNLDDLVVHSSSGVLPGFSGSSRSRPELRMNTTQIKDVLDKTTVNNIAAGYSGSNVDVEFLKADNLTGNVGTGSSSHVRLRSTRTLLCWDTITARQNETAEINFWLVPVSDGTNPPWAATTATTLAGTAVVAAVYTLGPIVVASTLLTKTLEVQGWNWSNALQLDEFGHGGSAHGLYAAVRRGTPSITIDSENVADVMSLVPAGGPITTIDFYLRKRLLGGINVANATEEHIKLSASVGTLKPVSARQIRAILHSFSVSTVSAIA